MHAKLDIKNQYALQDSDKPTTICSSKNKKCLSNKVLYKAKIKSTTENYIKRIATVSVKPSLSYDTQTNEKLLKTENANQTLNFPMKSGN